MRSFRIRSTRIRSAVVSLICLAPMMLSFGNIVAADEAVDPDATTLVVMAPSGPVLIQLFVLIDGSPYRSWVADFLGRKMDLDGDGYLDETELSLIPDRLKQQTDIRNAAQILKAAAPQLQSKTSAARDRISVDGFLEWFSERLSRSFNIVAAPVRASQAVRLASLLDADSDGAVSEEEIRNGGWAMRFRDLDNDDTFSASELMPFRDPRNQQAAVIPDVENLPFVQLTDDASIRRTADQILRQYGNGEGIEGSVLRLPVFDEGQRLTASDVERLLKTPTYHVDFAVQLSDRSNSSRTAARVSPIAAEFCAFESDRRGRGKLVVDGMPISVRARGGGTNARSFFTSFLLQRMSLYDEDKNDALSEDEFPQMQQQMASQQIMATFGDVDLNHDEQVTRQELLGYIERDAISTQSRIEVSVKQDGKTLFGLLDGNQDRRLTPRELLSGFEPLADYDLNKDGRLTESELGTEYVMEIGLAQPEALRVGSMNNMMMQPGSSDAVLPGLAGLNGPEWFRRMDRNQDNDVSQREFLGPLELFARFDLDADELLSAAEAERLQEATATE